MANQVNMDALANVKDKATSKADQEAAKKRLASVQAAEAQHEAERVAREKALRKIKVDKQHLQTLMDQLMLPKADADRALRENATDGQSDLQKTVRCLIGAL